MEWRREWNMEDYLIQARAETGLTMANLFGGGGLCTLGGVRAGFNPIWSTEVVASKQLLLEHISSARCYGDTFGSEVWSAPTPNLLWVTAPCIDYSLSGTKDGGKGDTGWMFIESAYTILEIAPDSFIIEQSGNTPHINGGAEMMEVCDILRRDYNLSLKVHKFWRYGDPTNRERLLIVGIHKRVKGGEFVWPEYIYDEDNAPTYRDIMVPDKDVPESYWRHDTVPSVDWQEPKPGKLHKIGQLGEPTSMGYSKNPHSVYSLDSLPNGQTRYNGGGRRPDEEWKQGDSINLTRMTVPNETCCMANLPEGEHSYERLCRSFKPSSRLSGDDWVRDCVNQGVPLATGTAISTAVRLHLEQAGVKPTGSKVTPVGDEAGPTLIPAKLLFSNAVNKNATKEEVVEKVSMLVDSGCYPESVIPEKHSKYLTDPTVSSAVIEIADATKLPAGLDGDLYAYIENRGKVTSFKPGAVIKFPATSCESAREGLFSLDPHWEDGWDIHFTQQESYMEKRFDDGINERIPFRRGEGGGWFIDLLVIPPEYIDEARSRAQEKQQQVNAALLQARAEDNEAVNSTTTRGEGLEVKGWTDGTDDLICYYSVSDDVLSVHPVDRDDDDDGQSYYDSIVRANSTEVRGTAERLLDPGGSSTLPPTTEDDSIAVEDGDTAVTPEGEGVDPWGEECYSCDEQRDDAPESEEVVNPVRKEFIVHHKADRRLKPTKKWLRFGKAKEPWTRCHSDFGHLGTCPGCKVCSLVSGAPRRMYQLVDPHREDRRGYGWVMDGITFDVRSNEGSKYMVILRDIATGYTVKFCLANKDDIRDKLEEWIKHLRRDQHFAGLTYQPVVYIKTDMAGEWDFDCAEFLEMLKRIEEETGADVKVVYASPCDPKKRRQGLAERTNAIYEKIIKSILMEQSLPPEFWEAAAADAEFLANRVPEYRSQQNLSKEGDQASPIELFTNQGVGRGQVYTELSYYVQVGTPCLVHDPEVKGASIRPKSSWYIAYGMIGGNPQFKDPLTVTKRFSKSYTSFKLRDGLNYSQYLGLGDIPSTRQSAGMIEDQRMEEGYVIDLTSFHKHYENEGGVKPVTPVVTDFTHRGEEPEPDVSRVPSAPGLRGTVDVIQPAAEQDTEPPKPGPAPMGKGKVRFSDDNDVGAQGDSSPPVQSPNTNSGGLGVMIGGDAEEADAFAAADAEATRRQEEKQRKSDKRAAEKVRHKAKVTGSEPIRFQTFAKTYLKIPHALVHVYLEWLLDHPDYQLGPEDGLMMGVRAIPYLPKHQLFVYPSGARWDEMVKASEQGAKLVSRKATTRDFILKKDLEVQGATRAKVLHDMKQRFPEWRYEGENPLCMLNPSELDSYPISANAAAKPKKVRRKAVTAGMEDVPNNTLDALNHPTRAGEWMCSLDKEFFGLVKLGVFKLGYTLKQLREMGIHSSPIPIGTVLDHKVSTLTGEIASLKSRMALKGHPGNMYKDIHYDETFAATPVGDTERMLQCLMLKLQLKRRAFDVSQAYLHAEMEGGYEQLIMEYPEGYQEWTSDGPEAEKLYILLSKNLYGHPAGARNWSRDRDEFLLTRFSEGEWVIKQCVNTDPCLFHIVRLHEPCAKRDASISVDNLSPHEVRDEMWCLIHTDDCDTYGTNDDILKSFRDILADKWGVKDVDAKEQLGVQRVLETEPKTGKILSVTVKMPVFIEGMASTFCDDEHYPKRDVSTPYPPEALPDVRVNKECVSEVEALGLVKKYQRAVGMFMWASRHVCPESQLAASYASRVLSYPSLENWKAILHGIKWMHQEKDRGVRYSLVGNPYPILTVDASNKPDSMSLCQSGHVAFWYGGPVLWDSKRNAHADCAAPRNEYMAMLGVAASVNWIRSLIVEAGFGEDSITHPTHIYTDSKGAKEMASKDKITRSFKIIRTYFHTIREMVRDGLCKVFHIWGKYNPADLMTKSNQRQRIHGDNDQAGYLTLCGLEPLRLEGMDTAKAEEGKEQPQLQRYNYNKEPAETDSGYDNI
ncbi:MAG: hypothetical protein CBB71_19130 [Rhodopirellula sp. TMED11]|nr:MAG: hypothetical protein CBB71_19130 [Rhodopirellula sp. TMED11]